MSSTAVIHEGLMNRSRTILPRVGGGVGVRGEGVVLHDSLLTEGPVDNPHAAANAAPRPQAACNAFGGDLRWSA